MDLERGFQLDDLSGLLLRRGVIMSAVLGVSVLLVVLIAGWLPNAYLAKATLLVEPQSISQKLVESGVPETELNNRLHLLQMQILARGRLSQVIDDLNVYPELAEKLTRAEVIEHMREKSRLVPVLPELAEAARAQTGVRAGDEAITTFQLQFEHRSAKVAAEVCEPAREQLHRGAPAGSNRGVGRHHRVHPNTMKALVKSGEILEEVQKVVGELG